jgi:hypothetical protein
MRSRESAGTFDASFAGMPTALVTATVVPAGTLVNGSDTVCANPVGAGTATGAAVEPDAGVAIAIDVVTGALVGALVGAVVGPGVGVGNGVTAPLLQPEATARQRAAMSRRPRMNAPKSVVVMLKLREVQPYHTTWDFWDVSQTPNYKSVLSRVVLDRSDRREAWTRLAAVFGNLRDEFGDAAR